jgi:hypothetical protein
VIIGRGGDASGIGTDLVLHGGAAQADITRADLS